MAKKVSAKKDAEKGSARFVDQKGQWTDRTPASVKKKQADAWKRLEASYKKTAKKKK